ncbi:MAG: hypothetical protein EHM41_23860 [Chloroflexi bacterium]|nr:MAG: hypothetical protein EHM41_23860 [Chloroflexota bacterium]
MMKRLYWLLSVLLLTALITAACQTTVPPTGDIPEPGEQIEPVGEVSEIPEGYVDTSMYRKDAPYTFCFSNSTTSNSWRVSMVAHLRNEVRLNPDIVAYYETDAENNPVKQVQDILDLVDQDCDVLLVSASVPAALTSVIVRVMNSNIPVVTVDTNISGDRYISFVEQNGCETAKMQADWLVNRLGGAGRVVLLAGLEGNLKAEQRLQCARETFETAGIEILAEAFTGWSSVTGEQIVGALLAAHGSIDGIWADSGRQASGAVEAFQNAGLPVPPITGEDYNGFLKKWKELGFDGYAVSSSVNMGAEAVKVAFDILQGNPVPSYVSVEPQVITAENLDQFVCSDLPDDYWAASLPEVTDELLRTGNCSLSRVEGASQEQD